MLSMANEYFSLLRTVFAEIMSLDDEHEKGIELLMSVDYAQKISWIPLSKDLRET